MRCFASEILCTARSFVCSFDDDVARGGWLWLRSESCGKPLHGQTLLAFVAQLAPQQPLLQPPRRPSDARSARAPVLAASACGERTHNIARAHVRSTCWRHRAAPPPQRHGSAEQAPAPYLLPPSPRRSRRHHLDRSASARLVRRE